VKLFLYNPYHAGDVVFSRPVVRDALRLGYEVLFGCQEDYTYLMRDLAPTVILPPAGDDFDGTSAICASGIKAYADKGFLPVSTWAGFFGDAEGPIIELGFSYELLKYIFNAQVKVHGLPEIINNDIGIVDLPANNNIPVVSDRPTFLVENGICKSGQSNYKFDLAKLADTFCEAIFYCSAAEGIFRDNITYVASYNLIDLSSMTNKLTGLLVRGSGVNASSYTSANVGKLRLLMGFTKKYGLWRYPGHNTKSLSTTEQLLEEISAVI